MTSARVVMNAGAAIFPMKETTALLVCDMQESFRPRISHFKSVLGNTCHLVEVAKKLGMAIGVTEQYPKVFQHTVPEIKDILPTEPPARPIVEKTSFSMVPVVGSWAKCKENIILTGIEAHVCVYQTACELLPHTRVYIPADAVSSQNPTDRHYALKGLADRGAIITTTESIVFQLLQDSKSPDFKAVQPLIKARAEDPNIKDSGLLSTL